LLPGGLWLYQIRNDEDDIRLALGRRGKSIDAYLLYVMKRFPSKMKKMKELQHTTTVWLRVSTVNPTPVLFPSFLLDHGHPRLTRLLWDHKLFFEYRRTPRVGLGRINVVPKLEGSREAGAIVVRQPFYSSRSGNATELERTEKSYNGCNKVFFR
jgi:hypothetical protein